MRGDRARSAVASTRFTDLRWVAETGSTNRDLLDLAAGGAPEGVVLVADHQTAGRGRLDRTWQAPAEASLLVSILLRPTDGLAGAHLLTTAVGLSAVEACRSAAGVEPRLKWPNDLVIDVAPDADSGTDADAAEPARSPTRKLGGILAESVVAGDRVAAVVVGLGLNVNWPAHLPPDLAPIATALNRLVGHEIDREALLAALLTELEGWCVALAGPVGASQLLDRARACSATLGRRVEVDLGTARLVGEAVELTDDGALVVAVEQPPGSEPRLERHVVVAGDVVHLRPAN